MCNKCTDTSKLYLSAVTKSVLFSSVVKRLKNCLFIFKKSVLTPKSSLIYGEDVLLVDYKCKYIWRVFDTHLRFGKNRKLNFAWCGQQKNLSPNLLCPWGYPMWILSFLHEESFYYNLELILWFDELSVLILSLKPA